MALETDGRWTTLEELCTALRRKVGAISSEKLKASDYDVADAARDALDELSSVRPKVLVQEIAGDGTTRRYVLATAITGWDDEGSQLDLVERVTDANTDQETKDEIEPDDYEIFHTASDGIVLMLDTDEIASTGETIRLTWTQPLAIEDLDGATETTVPQRHRQVVLLLAAERIALLAAVKASDLANETLGIDQVDFRTTEERWRRRAGEFRRKAETRLSPTGGLAASSRGTSVEYETVPRLRPRRISH